MVSSSPVMCVISESKPAGSSLLSRSYVANRYSIFRLIQGNCSRFILNEKPALILTYQDGLFRVGEKNLSLEVGKHSRKMKIQYTIFNIGQIYFDGKMHRYFRHYL